MGLIGNYKVTNARKRGENRADPIDLEIIDRVYKPPGRLLKRPNRSRDRAQDGERRDALSKLIMDSTETGRVDMTPSSTRCCQHARQLDCVQSGAQPTRRSVGKG